MKIELDSFGFMFNTEWAYVSLSWELLIVSVLLGVAYKFYKIRKGK
jgi:hypothetical protein